MKIFTALEFITKMKNKEIKTEEEVRLNFVMFMNSVFGIFIDKAERANEKSKRYDNKWNNVLIEYKKPGILSSKKNRDAAIEQVKGYGDADSKSFFVFDGQTILDVNNNEIYKTSEYNMNLFGSMIVSSKSMFFEMSQDNIQKYLGPLSSRSQKLLRLMYGEVDGKIKDQDDYKAWADLFSIASGTDESVDKSYLTTTKIKEIKDIFGDEAQYGPALFVLHTYFSLIVKNIVVQNLKSAKYLKSHIPAKSSEFEKGRFFIEDNIFNFFSDDLFSWYTKTSKELIHEIEGFNKDVTRNFRVFDMANMTTDFFNILYEVIMPHAVRKSLGEYYTPLWFAAETLKFGNVNYKKKFVDPTCGSGTFLIKVISEKIKLGLSLDEILSSIGGADLNPVSIIAAKANILIRLMPLKRMNESIFLPLFVNDSTLDLTKYKSEIYKNHVSGEGKVNLAVTTPSLNQIRVDVIEFIKTTDAEDFIKKIEATPYGHKNKVYSRELFKLRDIVKSLDDNSYERLRLQESLLASTITEYDYLIGNPPWVKWSNLPSTYRRELKARGAETLFSPYKNAGGNSLDIYAPIIKASSINFLKDDASIVMIMPMSLNFNSSMHNVRKFEWMKNNQKISKIKDYSSRACVFKGVSINFGIYIIDSSDRLEYIKVDKDFIESKKFPRRNTITNVLIPGETKEFWNQIEPLLGIRDSKIKVRSGVQFSPNKIRQYNIVDEKDGILKLKSAKTMKTQKEGIPLSEIYAEKESIVQVLRTSDLRRNLDNKFYSWFLYESTNKKEMEWSEVIDRFPILAKSLSELRLLLDNKNTSQFNDRISQSKWYGNTRVGNYTRAPYRICFPDNGAFVVKLITDDNIIPEGHVRFIPLYDKGEAKRVMEILSNPLVKELMRIQYLNLNKSFLPEYMYIKL